jgi:hypothetical protein
MLLHTAFDRRVGLRPGLIIEVLVDVLREADGLAYQGDDQQPNRELLAKRYDLFRQAS